MHIQGIHSQIIWMQVESVEELLHCDLPILDLVHDTVSVITVRLLDEAQKVFLVHAGSSVDMGVHLEWQREDKERITEIWDVYVV